MPNPNQLEQLGQNLNLLTGHTIGPVSESGAVMGHINPMINPTIGYVAPTQIAGLVKLGPCVPVDCRFTQQLKCYLTKVFGGPVNSKASYQNDVNSFLISTPATGNTKTIYQFVLKKNTLHYLNYTNYNNWKWQQVAVLNNNVYGTYYKQGSLAASSNYMGFSINWSKVLYFEGVGIYQIGIQTCIQNTTPATLFVPIAATTPGLYSKASYQNYVSSNIGTGNLTVSFSTTQKYTIAYNIANGMATAINAMVAAINAGGIYSASYTGLFTISSLNPGAQNNGVTVTITSSNPAALNIENAAGGNTITMAGGSSGSSFSIQIGTYKYNGVIGGTTLQNSVYMASLITGGGLYTATSFIKNGVQGIVISGLNGVTDNGTKVYSSAGTSAFVLVGALSGGLTTTGACTDLLCSEPFELFAWDCNKAAGTVKFEFTNSGTIGDDVNDGVLFNLVGTEWYDSIRVPGFFGEPGWKFSETLMEYGLDNNHEIGELESVQNKKIPGYKFYSKLLPYWVHNHLSTWLMSDTILVSDYGTNQPDYEGMQQKKVRMANNADYMPKWLSKNRFEADMRYKQRSGYVQVEFQAGIQSIIKNIC